MVRCTAAETPPVTGYTPAPATQDCTRASAPKVRRRRALLYDQLIALHSASVHSQHEARHRPRGSHSRQINAFCRRVARAVSPVSRRHCPSMSYCKADGAAYCCSDAKCNQLHRCASDVGLQGCYCGNLKLNIDQKGSAAEHDRGAVKGPSSVTDLVRPIAGTFRF
ncbi:hypothetical protein OAN61_00425 [bacterium]|nr:hypothetical protein [bacterium]